MLRINDLHASTQGQDILKGINLEIKPGEVHAIMGPNGSGKSTLSQVLAGNEAYEVQSGTVTYKDQDLLEMAAEQRALEGIFLAFQYPVEIPGVGNMTFLRTALNAQKKARGEADIPVEAVPAAKLRAVLGALEKKGFTLVVIDTPGAEATIVLLHPLDGHRRAMLKRLDLMTAAGYSVLSIDFQACGMSPGESITMGYLEALDAEAAVAYARTRQPTHKIGIIGWSLGGAAALLAKDLQADAVVLATEANVAAKLLASPAPDIATELKDIPMPHVAVVGLGFGPDALAKAPRGFGALIQRGGGIRILGVLWDTFLFPERSPDGTVLMRCMVGGATDPEAAKLTDEELVALTHADLTKLLNLDGTAPIFTEVVRWPNAIPQYEMGHLARMDRIHTAMASLEQTAPGLYLAGNYTAGVAFAKAAKAGDAAGREAAERVLKDATRPSQA